MEIGEGSIIPNLEFGCIQHEDDFIVDITHDATSKGKVSMQPPHLLKEEPSKDLPSGKMPSFGMNYFIEEPRQVAQQKDAIIQQLQEQLQQLQMAGWKLGQSQVKTILGYCSKNFELLKLRLFTALGVYILDEEKEAILAALSGGAQPIKVDNSTLSCEAWASSICGEMEKNTLHVVDMLFRCFLEEFMLRWQSSRDLYQSSTGCQLVDYKTLYQKQCCTAEVLQAELQRAISHCEAMVNQASVAEGQKQSMVERMDGQRKQFLTELLLLKEHLYEAQLKMSQATRVNLVRPSLQVVDFLEFPTFGATAGPVIQEFKQMAMDLSQAREEVGFYKRKNEERTEFIGTLEQEIQGLKEEMEWYRNTYGTPSTCSIMTMQPSAPTSPLYLGAADSVDASHSFTNDSQVTNTPEISDLMGTLRRDTIRRPLSQPTSHRVGSIARSSIGSLVRLEPSFSALRTGSCASNISDQFPSRQETPSIPDASQAEPLMNIREATHSTPPEKPTPAHPTRRKKTVKERVKESSRTSKKGATHVPSSPCNAPSTSSHIKANFTVPSAMKSKGKKQDSKQAKKTRIGEVTLHSYDPSSSSSLGILVRHSPTSPQTDSNKMTISSISGDVDQGLEVRDGAAGFPTRIERLQADLTAAESTIGDLMTKLETCKDTIDRQGCTILSLQRQLCDAQGLVHEPQQSCSGMGLGHDQLRDTALSALMSQLGAHLLPQGQDDNPSKAKEEQASSLGSEMNDGFNSTLVVDLSNVPLPSCRNCQQLQTQLLTADEEAKARLQASENQCAVWAARIADMGQKLRFLNLQKRQWLQERESWQWYAATLQQHVPAGVQLPEAPRTVLMKLHELQQIAASKGEQSLEAEVLGLAAGQGVGAAFHLRQAQNLASVTNKIEDPPLDAVLQQTDPVVMHSRSLLTSNEIQLPPPDPGIPGASGGSYSTRPLPAGAATCEMLPECTDEDYHSDDTEALLQSLLDLAAGGSTDNIADINDWTAWRKHRRFLGCDRHRRAAMDRFIIRNFQRLDAGQQYFEIFEAFAQLHYELNMLLKLEHRLISDPRDVDVHKDSECALKEEWRALLARFKLFRAIETYTGVLLVQMHRHKEMFLSQRAGQLDAVFSTIGYVGQLCQREMRCPGDGVAIAPPLSPSARLSPAKSLNAESPSGRNAAAKEGRCGFRRMRTAVEQLGLKGIAVHLHPMQ